MNFSDNVIIVTGASNGLGKSIALAYAEKNGKVILADVDEETGTILADQIRKQGGEALYVKTDVRKDEDLIDLMNFTVQNYGKIDILINNAGKFLVKSPLDLTVEEWDDIINTNLRSVFIGSREAAKHMRKNEQGGSIVNIASTRALMSEPNTESYAATKGGILALTHAFAASLGNERITVNAISPGWIETGNYNDLREIDHKQHLSNRVGKPSDIARACLYLTAKENDFITGINLVVDGGMTRKMIYEE